ncbi:AfsR/SARP family transcriptional regulator [Micromonospora sp. LH3U1]|uniref:AfsR/SARP family transcriptional regulator n=1 Tax=Micromonospora sp. LH3U1 TaxID=3018339 RepID=UPI00234B4212|nr:BTAD domain-containing putative transcriptional regulator [Micromonospora sp. LH3U1]WCN79473.1 BTAD domain-containing putative transcriptional regulator [Micromonospora sp. LH3U1]
MDPAVGPPPIRYRLLGPVEVWSLGGERLALGTPMQVRLLAILMSQPGTGWSIDQLVDELWQGRPPKTAAGNVKTYVWALRRALRSPGSPDPAILAGATGYRLVLDAQAIDTVAFDDLAQRGYHALRQGRWSDALQAFEAALALWRGEPFGGLPGSGVLLSVRTRLQEQRSSLLEEIADIQLRAGRHNELIEPLRRQIDGNPLRERPWGQLMIALAGAGRRADALATYRQLRRLLSDEVGVEPAPDLQHLHTRILRADRELLTSGARPPEKPAPQVPRQLPAPPALFTGRTRELARLTTLLLGDAGAAGTVAVTGTGGVGKTWLALRWAHDNLHHFPDGQLHVDLAGFGAETQEASPSAVVVRSLLPALGVKPLEIPAEPAAQFALYRSLTADRRLLVLLDNARDAQQVRPLLPGSTRCGVIVTSRHTLPGLVTAEGAQPVALDLLSTAEARQLLVRRLGVQRATAQPAAVDELISRTARLPLALSIVAARAAARPTFPLQAIADELAASRGGLAALATDDAATDLRTVLSWSYRLLSADAARLFRQISLHPGADVSAAAAASLADAPPHLVRPALDELTRANLLAEQTPNRFRCHDLLRAYGEELTDLHDSPADRRAIRKRLLDHYLCVARDAVRLVDAGWQPLDPPPLPVAASTPAFADHRSALAWFAVEQRVLLAAVQEAVAHSFDAHAGQLAQALTPLLSRLSQWHDLAAVQAIAITVARRRGDPCAEASAHRDLALAHIQLRRFGAAHHHLRRALARYEQVGDRPGLASAHLHLAWLSDIEGLPGAALPHAREALALASSTGDRLGEAAALNALGWSHARLDEHARAITYCKQALALYEEAEDRLGAAHTWDSLGFAYHGLGTHPTAADCYQRALTLYSDVQDQCGRADTLVRLGDTHQAVGNHDTSVDMWRQALAIFDRVGHPQAGELSERLAAYH